MVTRGPTRRSGTGQAWAPQGWRVWKKKGATNAEKERSNKAEEV